MKTLKDYERLVRKIATLGAKALSKEEADFVRIFKKAIEGNPALILAS